MNKEHLKEPHQILKTHRNTLKKRIVDAGTSDRFVLAYAIICTSLAIVYMTRFLLGIDHNRLIDSGIECVVIWFASFRHYCARMLYPDSWAHRWWSRILIFSGLLATFSLVTGWPEDRVFR